MDPAFLCLFCKADLSKTTEKTTTLGQKGVDGIIAAALKRGDNDMTVCVGQKVHESCRKIYTSHTYIQIHLKKDSTEQVLKRPSLRSEDDSFNPKEDCLYCGLTVNKKAKNVNYHKVESTAFQISLKEKIDERNNDEWSTSVLGRLNAFPDCFAFEMIYHGDCDSSFRKCQSIPKKYVTSKHSKKMKLGGSTDNEKMAAFESAVALLTSTDDNTVTVDDLVQHMKLFLGCDKDPYSHGYVKKLLMQRFPEEIHIAGEHGRADVITLQKNVSCILREFHHNARLNNDESEKDRIISAAASLVMADIKKTAQERGMKYPSPSELGSELTNIEFIPDSLKMFLTPLIPCKKSSIKLSAIAQSIIQAAKPKTVIAPLQIGLAIQLHHSFGSRQLIDTVHSLGFCSSYTETERFLRNAAVSNADTNVNSESFIQFVGDNLDHNMDTIDSSSFHGMGIISISTPGEESNSNLIVERANATMNDVIESAKIEIKNSPPLEHIMPGISFDVNCNSETEDVGDTWEDLDFLWRISRPLVCVPPYSAFMSAALHDEGHPGVSGITFLPTIDMSPTEPSCILSTLHYVNTMCRGRITPVLTFDQPLYWKAMNIIANMPENSPLKNVVLRLGPFHIMMSYLASIGHIMGGSGLKDALQTIHGEVAATHVLSGKAVSRSVRANSIIQSGLIGHLISHFTNEKSRDDMNEFSSLKDNAVKLITDLMHERVSVDDVTSNDDLKTLKSKFKDMTEKVMSESRTSSLWMQYNQMIIILHKFIRAERTGNFKLHLRSVFEMLPYLAAAGHYNYTKSVVVYLQQMKSLCITHPEIHAAFLKGCHVARRTNRFWAGISSDLTIEQTLMRSAKSTGGLTRKRGFTDGQRSLWVKSMPARAAVNNAMKSVTTESKQSEIHKDANEGRMKRDHDDIQKVTQFFSDHSPFDCGEELKNIATGEFASKAVNADEAKAVGDKIVQSMDRVAVCNWTFKKTDTVKTFLIKSPVVTDSETIVIEQSLLFQRLLSCADRLESSQKESFEFELCSFAPSLFDMKGFFLESKKSDLANYVFEHFASSASSSTVQDQSLFVIDGGALLFRVFWPRPSRYGQILDSYVEYVKSNYSDAVVVFDGYGNLASTKDMTRTRRQGNINAPEIVVQESNEISVKREIFFSNKKKQRSLC